MTMPQRKRCKRTQTSWRETTSIPVIGGNDASAIPTMCTIEGNQPKERGEDERGRDEGVGNCIGVILVISLGF